MSFKLESIFLGFSDRLSEETEQSSAQTGKHRWKVFNNSMTLSQPTTVTHTHHTSLLALRHADDN